MPAFLSIKEIEQCQTLIQNASSVVITTHKSPDGDAIGSSMALLHALRRMNVKALVVVPDAVPEFLQFFEGFEDVIVFDQDTTTAAGLIASADLIFCLDYNQLSRTGEAMAAALNKARANMILIDHHEQPADFPVVTYSDTASCSTAQMVYRFIVSLGREDVISGAVAEGIYCGIMTDSGSFRFPAVTEETHLIAGTLIAGGLDHARIHRAVYDTNLLDRVRLVGYALSEKLVVLHEFHTAYISLTAEELKRFNYRPGDTEGLVNQALSIRGIQLAAFFSGGGHKNAAGGNAREPMDEVLRRFREQLPSLNILSTSHS
jgi:bifunctional oligoribonuclease and PAP phosphatase NrnA